MAGAAAGAEIRDKGGVGAENNFYYYYYFYYYYI